MKRKTALAIIAMMLAAVSLTACGKEAVDVETGAEVSSDDSESTDGDDLGDYHVFSTDIDEDEEMGIVRFTELIVEGDEATVRLSTECNEKSYVEEYLGAISYDEDTNVYEVAAIDYAGDSYYFFFSVEGDKIVNFKTSYSEALDESADFSDIVGTYEADTECGHISFEVAPYGIVGDTIMIDGNEVEGSLIIYGPNDDYDLMFTDLDEDYHDWYIYISGSTFTYANYYEVTEQERLDELSGYEGEYGYSGPLGSIVITVADGWASTTLEVLGREHEFTDGYISLEEGQMSSVSFEGEVDGQHVIVNLFLNEDLTYAADVSYMDNYYEEEDEY